VADNDTEARAEEEPGGLEEGDTLLGHLMELKRRITRAVIAVVVGFGIAYPFKERIYDYLAGPVNGVLADHPQWSMQLTHPAEGFVTYLKLSLLAGFLIGLPVVLYQFWAFVAPGLYRGERRAFFPVLLLSIALFFAGAAFSFFLVFPLAFQFLLGFAGEHLEANIKMNEYLGFSITLLLAFGASFQVPIINMVLVKLGFTTVAGLRAKRRYVFAGAFLLAALITPPDVVSQVLLGFPVWLLYELGILLSTRIRTRDEEAAEAAGGEGEE
jgi:sec-independent protein translocase protein TatC